MDVQAFLLQLTQSLPGLLFAIVAHEWAHGYMAKRFGDNTAERSGRLTFNPAAHIDPFGTVIMPLMLLAMGWGAFGYAKPVPVDVRNFKDFRKGIFWVSFAGPLANFIIGIISAFLWALFASGIVSPEFAFHNEVRKILEFSLIINFVLGGFNLIPIPPLDGSKMVASFLKGEMLRKYEELARYANFIFLGLIALSIAGVHILSYFIYPFVAVGNLIANLFLQMLS